MNRYYTDILKRDNTSYRPHITKKQNQTHTYKQRTTTQNTRKRTKKNNTRQKIKIKEPNTHKHTKNNSLTTNK